MEENVKYRTAFKIGKQHVQYKYLLVISANNVCVLRDLRIHCIITIFLRKKTH